MMMSPERAAIVDQKHALIAGMEAAAAAASLASASVASAVKEEKREKAQDR